MRVFFFYPYLNVCYISKYKCIKVLMNKQKAEGTAKASEKEFQSLAFSGDHTITSPLSRLHAPSIGCRHQVKLRVIQDILNQISEHTPASSILSGVTFVKWLSASQEPRKTLPYGKALKWGSLRH